MTKYNMKIVEKFRKKDNICNICLRENSLTDDHVPPKACPPSKNIVISKLHYQMSGDRSLRPRISQSGVSYKTICRACNNKLGSDFDWALGEFSRKIESFVESPIALLNSFEVECYPNAVMRSVLGHLVAAKTETDQGVIDDLIRSFIFDPSLPIHNDIHIFYWVYPYDKTIILRDFAMPAVRGMLNTIGSFNMIKFYPIAFLITHKLASYEGLSSLHQFNGSSPSDIVRLKINLKPIQRSTWPEECLGLENFLMLSRSADDSVHAVPKKSNLKF